jgi:NADH dehydrogenase [ubiquinone] 1 alpha subcomplex assembly factor 5
MEAQLDQQLPRTARVACLRTQSSFAAPPCGSPPASPVLPMAASSAAAARLLLLRRRNLLPNLRLSSSSAADGLDDGGGGGRVKIFDRDLKRRHRDRAAWAAGETDALTGTVSENLVDRLEDCRKAFPSALCLGGSAGAVRRALRGRGELRLFVPCAPLRVNH